VFSDAFWLAMALVLVIEGLFPFISPGGWRRMFSQILQLSDGQIRFFGLLSILAGLAWVWWQLPA
jgi:uncharacterized protein YjeT (DUF2065 family)